MGKTEAGLLLFIEAPEQIAARWTATHLPHAHAVPLLEALHQDLLSNLRGLADTTVYLTDVAGVNTPYLQSLARRASLEVIELPPTSGLQAWDSGLSILYNRCRHPKILCADAQIPDLYADDVLRARRKLDLYDVVLGREGEDGCWLIGMHGYTDFLSRVTSPPAGLLHSILETGVEHGKQVSLLDTKTSVRDEPAVETLRFLAARDHHPELRGRLDAAGLLPPPDEGS